jgi:1,4-dihydroxy-2-naphthoyl-CoA synthase
VHPADLGAHPIRVLVDRTGIDPGAIEDVVYGCIDAIGAQAGDIARTAALVAGLPEHVPGVTVAPEGRLTAAVCSQISDGAAAGESAKFLAGATRVGMAPDAGVSVTLPHRVGLRKVLEITLTNLVLSAADALRIGLITTVAPDDALLDEALGLARSLAAGPTRALGAAKRLVWSGLGSRVEAQLPEEARTVAELSGTADALEGLAAVIEHRKPTFTGH